MKVMLSPRSQKMNRNLFQQHTNMRSYIYTVKTKFGPISLHVTPGLGKLQFSLKTTQMFGFKLVGV